MNELEWLQNLYRGKELPVARLVEMTGLTQSTVYAIVRGVHSDPGYIRVRRLAAAARELGFVMPCEGSRPDDAESGVEISQGPRISGMGTDGVESHEEAS